MSDMGRVAARKHLTALLLAFGLAAKLLVPVGWMPVASAQGFAIEMCGGEGPISTESVAAMKEASDRLNAGPGKPMKDKHGAEPACPFAALTLGLGVDDTRVPPKPVALVQRTPALSLAVAVGRGLAAPPPPPTGPPALA